VRQIVPAVFPDAAMLRQGVAELVAKLKRELRPARILGSEADGNAAFPIAQDIGDWIIPPMINLDQIELAAGAMLPDLISGGLDERLDIIGGSRSPIVAIDRDLEGGRRRKRRNRWSRWNCRSIGSPGARPCCPAHSEGSRGADEMAACERYLHSEGALFLPAAGRVR